MNYNTASYIKCCVLALSIESGFPSICAACRHRPDSAEEWEVCLYSRLDVAADFFNFVILAKAICGLAPSLTFYEGQFDSGVMGIELHHSVIIW